MNEADFTHLGMTVGAVLGYFLGAWFIGIWKGVIGLLIGLCLGALFVESLLILVAYAVSGLVVFLVIAVMEI